MSKCGTKEAHCCWFSGEQCQFLTPACDPGYVWCCSLRKQYGSWPAVHASPEYLENVKPKMIEAGYIATDCGSWPPPGMVCNDCGEGK